MAKLIYSMLMSLDGYVEDAQGKFDWARPDDPEVHTYINQWAVPIGTYLYGRRMYEMMVYWETVQATPEHPQVMQDWAHQWKAADKIVYSRSLAAPQSARTRIERAFEPDAIRALKATAAKDITVNGPNLAAQALRAGLVDEVQLFLFPVLVGGGKRFFPDGVQAGLTLVEQRQFASGVMVLRYLVGAGS